MKAIKGLKNFNRLKKGRKHGVEGFFIPISSTQGVKIYPTRSIAQETCNRQIRAWNKGLAPRVFTKKVEKCRFTWPKLSNVDWAEGEKYGYFYVTEIAPYSAGNYEYKEYAKLERGMNRLRMGNDLHDNNIRRLRNKKLVAIDFGEYS